MQRHQPCRCRRFREAAYHLPVPSAKHACVKRHQGAAPMSWQRPSPRIVWRAIDTYLEVAYAPVPEGNDAIPPAGKAAGTPSAQSPEPTPSAVRARLETLKSTPVESFYDSPVFERLEMTRAPGDPPPPR